MSADALIDVADLAFAWPGQAPCLTIERLTIGAGERVFLFGESGSGKSTLLGLLGGVLTPQRGALRVLGRDLATLRPAARDAFRVDHVGFVFQQFNLIPYLSVLEQVLLPCRFSARRAARATRRGASLHDEARRLLAAVGIHEALLARAVTQLSVGQQQRVAAARALIGAPELLIADEPTSALDAARQDAFVELLLTESEASGATVVFVSHDHRLARHFTRELALADINRAIAASA